MISGEPSLAAEVEILRREVAELKARVAGLEGYLAKVGPLPEPAEYLERWRSASDFLARLGATLAGDDLAMGAEEDRRKGLVACPDSSLLAWGEHLVTQVDPDAHREIVAAMAEEIEDEHALSDSLRALRALDEPIRFRWRTDPPTKGTEE